MARSTARTGKLKRSKARRPSDGAGIRAERSLEEGVDPSTRHASVGELLAALDGGRRTGPPASDDAPAPTEGEPAEPAAQAETAAPVEPSPTPGDGEPARPRWTHTDPDDLGLAGYEDDDSQDDPLPEAEPTPEPRADGVELSDTLPMAPEDDLSRVKGPASPRLMSVIESLLFASERPLTVRDIRRLLKEPTVRQVQLALKQLQIDTAERGVVLSQVAGGFRLRTNPSNAQWVQRMLAGKPARLSRSQLEALAVIAYRQPITKAEIDHVRGVDCGAVLRLLLERNLCRIVGRKEEPGRPHLYGTTVEFLEFFNLRSLRDMPDLHEFRELTEENRATVRAEFGEDADELEAEVLGQEVLPFGSGEGPTASEAGPEGEAAAASEAAEEPGEAPAPAEQAEGDEERDEAPAPAEQAEGDEERDEAQPEALADREDAEPEAVEDSGDGEEPEALADREDADEPESLADTERTDDREGSEDEDAEDSDEDDAPAAFDAAEDSDDDEPEPADDEDDAEDSNDDEPEPADDATDDPSDLDARSPLTLDELDPTDDEDPEEAAS